MPPTILVLFDADDVESTNVVSPCTYAKTEYTSLVLNKVRN